MVFKLNSLAVIIALVSSNTAANGYHINRPTVTPSGSYGHGKTEYQDISEFVLLPRNTVTGKSEDAVSRTAGTGKKVGSRPDAASLPSLPKLFGISLLWIPFNRWKKKH